VDRQPKISNLLETISKCIEEGRYLDTRHATQRQSERNVTRPEYLHALLNGYHEKRKDRFEEIHQAWNYSVRGKTIDGRSLRIVVSFDKNNMLIITAIDLSKG